MDDYERLGDFVRRGSQEAFRELVDRHLPMVFSTAQRMVRNAELAEEVTQAVFTTLAQKASSLSPPQVVAGWLYNTTRHLSLHTVRSEQRRRQREETAAAMQSVESRTDTGRVLEELEPAMGQLDKEDRDALVLRYLEDRALREVGAELGISEDAARMRINRALEKLRTTLSGQGVSVSATVLATALATSSTGAVPAGLGTVAVASALAGAATTATPAAVTGVGWIGTKIIAFLVLSALVTGTIVHLIGQREANRLLNRNQILLAQQEELRRERDSALSASESSAAEIARLEKNAAELLRLRGEVAMLRQQVLELQELKAGAGQPQEGTTNQVESGKTRDAKVLLLALHTYASDHGDLFFPTNLNQLDDLLVSTDEATGLAVSQLTGTNHFELILRGPLPIMTNLDTPKGIIAVREREPSFIDGKWVKAYGFLDGHAELVEAPPEGFEAWEKQRTFSPPEASR